MTDTDLLPDTPETPAQRPSLRWLWLLLTFAALTAAAWFGWRHWQAQQAQADRARSSTSQQIVAIAQSLESLRRDQRGNARSIQDAAATNRVLRDEVLGLGQRSALLEESVAKLADSSRHGVQALRREEAELLLNQALQRLNYAGDLEGARRLYTLAAGVLAQMEGPDYLNLQQALTQERSALDALGKGVRADTAVRLDAWNAAVQQLPEHRPASTAAPWWQQAIAPLVKVRPSSPEVLVADSERTSALDALQLEASLARMALERGDQPAWQRALDHSGNWVRRLWPDTPARAQRLTELAALRATNLQPAIPELGSTLQQLRSLRLSGDSQ